MAKPTKKITVHGIKIRLDKENDYVSLNDIAVQNSTTPAYILIRSWLKNRSTLTFLKVWEELHNPNFNTLEMGQFVLHAGENRNEINTKKYVEITGAIGLYAKTGRYGGTYAHKDIALNFCYWLSPGFQVYLMKEFQRLKEMEFEQKSLEWHVSMITDRIDDVRNLLDTIPGQHKDRNRLKGQEIGEEE